MGAFDEVSLPKHIAVGTSSGPGVLAGIQRGRGDLDEIIVRAPNARRRWNLRTGLKTREDAAALHAFAIARRGIGVGWRIEDPLDNSTAADHIGTPGPFDCDMEPSIADGSNLVFQIRTKYVSGPTTIYRRVLKPTAGTVRVGTAVEQVSPGWTFPWTVDVTTGLVTFDSGSAPLAGLPMTAGCRFETQARFGDELATGHLAAGFRDGKILEFDDIPAIELLDLQSNPQPRPTLGGNAIVANADMRLAWTMGTAILFTGNGSVRIYMPREVDLTPGYYHHFVNGTSGTLAFHRFDGALIAGLLTTKSAFSFVYPANGQLYWALAKG